MIVRSKRSATFTVVSNQVINDPDIGWAELGLLVYLLSKPDNWQVSASHLAKQRKAGRDAIYAMLKRLRDAGYAKYKRNADGTTDWIILDNPHPDFPDKAQGSQKPHPENPDLENPDLDNPTQVNTDCVVNTDSEQTSGSNEPGATAPPTDLFGGKPPPKQPETLTEDARSQMWRMGVSLLTNQGMSNDMARKLLGKWAQQGEKKLAGVIGECAVKPPADARAYINAAMQNAYNLYDEKQLQAAAKAYGVKIKQKDSWDSLRQRVQDAMRGGVAA